MHFILRGKQQFQKPLHCSSAWLDLWHSPRGFNTQETITLPFSQLPISIHELYILQAGLPINRIPIQPLTSVVKRHFSPRIPLQCYSVACTTNVPMVVLTGFHTSETITMLILSCSVPGCYVIHLIINGLYKHGQYLCTTANQETNILHCNFSVISIYQTSHPVKTQETIAMFADIEEKCSRKWPNIFIVGV